MESDCGVLGSRRWGDGKGEAVEMFDGCGGGGWRNSEGLLQSVDLGNLVLVQDVKELISNLHVSPIAFSL
jgi:hypothetical protein